MRLFAPFLMCLLPLCLGLGACGKKPSFVDAPKYDADGNYLGYQQLYGPDGLPDTPGHMDGAKPVKDKEDFPRVYPKPWL